MANVKKSEIPAHDWIAGQIVGSPQATQYHTVEGLKGMGFVGVYATVKQPIECVFFLSNNALPLLEVATFLDFSQGMAIGFVEVDALDHGEALIESLRSDPMCQDIQFCIFDFSERSDVRFLFDEMVHLMQSVEQQEDKKLVLVLKGLESTISAAGSHRLLADLNFVRDAFKSKMCHPMLFMLPSDKMQIFRKSAPDFFDWRSGVFIFDSYSKTRG